MVYHVELGGFVQFETVEEARSFIAKLDVLFGEAKFSNGSATIFNPETVKNFHPSELVYDESKVFVGLQKCNARLNQLDAHAKKYTSIVSGIDWTKHILTCVDNRYGVDEEEYVNMCSHFLNDGVTLDFFVANIPEEKIVPVN